ncbi:MAG: hypothetical protein D6791_14015, partial [Chloroflexi bacterium]
MTRQVAGRLMVKKLMPAETPTVIEETLVRVGDTVQSRSDTEVELRLVDGSIVELGPNTTLQVVDISLEAGRGQLYHSAGTVRLAVRSLLSWELDTRTLRILPRLEATDLTVEVGDGMTRVAVADGAVVARRGERAMAVRTGEVLEADAGGTLVLWPAATATKSPTVLASVTQLPTATRPPR